MQKADSKQLKELVEHPAWPLLLALVQEWQDRDREDLLALAGQPSALEARGRWLRAQEFLALAASLAADLAAVAPPPDPAFVDDGF